ncbi:hypothetical protein ACIQYZ_14695 [Rhodococcus erythropolis]
MSEIRSQATPARDELDEKIQRWLTSADKIASTGYSHQKVRLCESMGFDWHETIAALQKALPRTVNSATELDALPVGSVVWTQALVGPVGHIFVKCAGMWIIPWHDTAEDPLEQNGSVTVLFTPGEAG